MMKMLTTLLPPYLRQRHGGGLRYRPAGGFRPAPNRLCAAIALRRRHADGYENLLIFAKLYDIPRREREERIRAALAFMGLSDVAEQMVRKYSGGMIRRLEIAQSLLHRPQVLFLDEPTVGLDPSARRAVWEHITQLCAEYGTTIFLTTHLMEEADSLCTRVAIMHRGEGGGAGHAGAS